ncbi:MAG TPA: DUF1501 domain-containing protein, partial [Luteolibacter sp.]|nr:DUF1501 domain-containing protein [Luteolibacter sp.]
IVHPSNGAWVAKLGEAAKGDLPSFVLVGGGNQHPGAGFFEPSCAPLPIGDPKTGLQNVQRRGDTTEEGLKRQLDLRLDLDHDFDTRFHGGQNTVRAYNDMYEAAVRLMHSKDLTAFDLSREPEATRSAYGTDRFAQGVLLARRLIEHGVRFVEVEYGGFDWHSDNFNQMEEKIPVLDQALAALLADLAAKGLLESTLVVVATEFGRSPQITPDAGRNHYPKAFSCLLAGGGVRGGRVHGATDETGSNVTEGQMGADDFNATIAFAMGIPHDKVVMSPTKRPFRMGGIKGKPVTQLFT